MKRTCDFEGKGDAPSLPEHRFCVFDGEELREGEGHSKAVQASANAATKWVPPKHAPDRCVDFRNHINKGTT